MRQYSITLLTFLDQVTSEVMSGGSTLSATSSGLGSSPATCVPHHDYVEEELDVEDGELQTKKLVSACNSAVRRLSSPLTSDCSDPIELNRLQAWQDDQDSHSDDIVQQATSPRR